MNLKQAVFAAALLLGSSGLAVAQGTAPSATTTGNPSAAGTTGTRDSGTSSDPNANAPRSDAGLERGANSFTEGQARKRIEDHGYTNVGQLHKDQNSIWQADAMKNGQQVRVGLDFRGNVVEEK